MRAFSLIVSCVITCSCSSPIQLPNDISATKKVFLPFRIDSIVVVDERADTLTADMRLPVVSAKRKEWLVKPGLGGIKTEIISMIESASNPEGLPTVVTFTAKDGYYKITGSATKVGEHAQFDCELNFRVVEFGTNYIATGSAYYRLEGVFNATEKHVKEVYRITLRNSLFNALKESEKVFEK